MRALVPLLVAAGAVAALLGTACDGREPAEAPPVRPPERTYLLRLAGDPAWVPWNRTLFLTTAANPRPDVPVGCIFFEDEPGVRVRGGVGEPWRLRSETDVTAAVGRMLWMTDVSGVFGDEETIDVPLAPRADVVLTGAESEGATDDVLTCVDEASGARLAAVRNSAKGLRFAAWDAASWRLYSMQAPPRPWVWDESRPGTYVLAARTAGRQWLARRAELRPGESVVLDVAAQPPGGGEVLCEAPGADLLLGGALPVPCLRLTEDTLRSRWEGVPPGRHAVRYPGGEVVPVDVADGAAVRLPRTPPSR